MVAVKLKPLFLMRPKHFVLLALAALLISASGLFANPLDNWSWRNPLPTGNSSDPHVMHGIVFANGTFVGVGDNGYVSLSYDATNWTERSTATDNQLNRVTYGGGLFVAVGANGTVETSADGTNWTLQSSGTTSFLVDVAAANGRYVAVGSSSVITSSDGATWSAAGISGLTNATAITGSSKGFLAIDGSSKAYFSLNGLAWTNVTLTAPPTTVNGTPNHRIVTFFNGSFYLGSLQSATSMTVNEIIYASTNGINWTTNLNQNIFVGIGRALDYYFFMSGNGYLIAEGTLINGSGAFLQSSVDGLNWATTNGIPEISEHWPASGAFGNGNYVVMVLSSTGSLPEILVSHDGLNWSNQQHLPITPVGPTDNFYSIAYSNGVYVVGVSNYVVRSTNGTVYSVVSNSPALSYIISATNGFIGVGNGGNIYQSSDGATWTQRNSATANNLHGIVRGNGLLVAVGDNGTIQTSPTGVIWTTRSSGTSLPLYSVAYSNGLFVAVGRLGTVLTSSDGINWTGQDAGTVTNLMSVAYGPAGFLAVGPGGVIVSSFDGVNWTAQSAGTNAGFQSVTFGNGYYLIAGNNGVVMTSPDGINWTSRNIGVTGGQNLLGCAFLNGRFDVVGSSGTLLESDVVPVLFTVQLKRTSNTGVFTIDGPAGNSFRLQSCTNLTTAGWADVVTLTNSTGIITWTNVLSGSPRFYRAVSP